jgi:hypothetical protein
LIIIKFLCLKDVADYMILNASYSGSELRHYDGVVEIRMW